MTENTAPIDVWLKFESDDDENASHEANTYIEDDRFRVEWSNVDVGQVEVFYCDSYAEVEWTLRDSGYVDYTA